MLESTRVAWYAVWLALALAGACATAAADFTDGDLVVYRVGDGVTALSSAAAPVFIDEYTPSGTLVQSVALPTAGAGANHRLVGSGSASSEGLLTLSADGRYVMLTGYDVAVGTAGVKGLSSAAAPRVVGRVDIHGAIDTSTALTDSTIGGDNFRSATSLDGTQFWAGAAVGGLHYNTIGASSSTQVSTTIVNIRGVVIAGGQLYVSTTSGSTVRIGTVGSGTPTTSGQLITNLPGIPSTAGPTAFAFVDLSPAVPGIDTLYIADASSVTKFCLVGGTWTACGSIAAAAPIGLAAVASGSSVTLFTTSSGSGSSGTLSTFTDTSGYDSPASGTATSIVSVTGTKAFRGVTLVPPHVTVTPNALSLTEGGASLTYTVALKLAPASPIDILASSPDGQVLLSTGGPSSSSVSLHFDAANLSRTVTVTAVDDGAAIGPNLRTGTITHAITSGATGFPTGTIGGAAVAIGIADADNHANQPPTISVIAPFSGAIGDPTNPTVGFTIADSDTPVGDLTLGVTSSNPGVAPASAVSLVNNAGAVTMAVSPAGVGYTDITVTVSDGNGGSASRTVHYGASLGGGPTSRFFTGCSDASGAIALDASTMLVADDEPPNLLRIYPRTQSGPALAQTDMSPTANTPPLQLTDTSAGQPREVDLEALARVGDRVYALGSGSNSSSGNAKPNRSRVFAVDLSGSGGATTMTFAGRYDFLRADLIAWDQDNLHGLGANHYGLAASAADGVIPESPGDDGFNIEGLAMAPGSTTTAYIAFRAPFVPPGLRNHALIVPVTNFATLAVSGGAAGTSGGIAGSAVFGAPIELDLGGRGIRDIAKNAADEYVIIGGAASDADPVGFQLYTWNGQPGSAPVARAADLSGMGPEAIVEVPAGPISASTAVQLLSDCGDTIWYGDSTIAKDLPSGGPYRKFRSDVVALGAPVGGLHLAVPPSASLLEDGSVAIAIAIAGSDPSAAAVTLTAASSDPGLFAPAGMVFSGSGPTRTLTLTPLANANGSAQITIGGSDGFGSDSQIVLVTVAPVNDAPGFAPGGDVTVLEDAGPQALSWATAIGAGPGNEAGQTVSFAVVNDAPALFAVQPAISPTGTLSFTAAADASGVAHVTATIHDDGGIADGGADVGTSASFTIAVTPVNDAPSFTAGPAVAVNEDSGAYAAPWASAISAGAPDEAGQALSFLVGCDHPTLFSVMPSIDGSGALSFTVAHEVSGVAHCSVALHDDGGGADTSAAVDLTITVNAVNDAPSFVAGADVTVSEDAAPQSLPWATAISAGPADEAAQQLAFTVDNDDHALFSAQPAISPTGTLSFTAAPNANGSAHVTVQLADDGGTARGGSDVSAVTSFLITVTPVNDPPVATAPPSISGSAIPGMTLTASPGTWNDDADGGGAIAFAYQWQIAAVNSDAAFAAIGGATSTTYAVQTADLGKYLRVRVTATDSGAPGTASASAVSAAVLASRPANDSFAARIALGGISGNVQGTNRAATKESGEPNHAGNAGGHSVWWTWTAPTAGLVVIDTLGSDFDTLLAVYTGSAVNALTVKVSNNDIGSGTKQSRVSFTAVAGTAYQIAVDGAGGAVGSIQLTWSQAPVPGNDAFASALAISGPSGSSGPIDTTSATKESGEPNHAGNGGGRSVWWTWTAPANGTVVFDTLGSSFDTLLAAYTGSAVGSLTAVASNNDIGSGNRQSRISIVATAGTTYQIAVDGAGGASGQATLSWSTLANDAFAQRLALSGLAGSTVGSNVGATKETGEPTPAGGSGRSVWWTYTPSAAGTLTVDTVGSAFNTTLAVYTGSAVNALTTLASNNDIGGGNQQSRVSIRVAAGTTCQIGVDGAGNDSGAIALNWSLVPFPPGDAFADRVQLPSDSGSLDASNVGATRESGEPKHAGNAGGGSAWFKWKAPSSGSFVLHATSTSVDTLLAVYVGASPSGLTTIVANDDLSAVDRSSLVGFKTVAGVEYEFAVDGCNGQQGDLHLEWQFVPFPGG